MCDEYIVLMNMLIDGEASPEERQRLSEHLSVCESCRAEYARLKYMADVMNDIQQDAPENLHSSIMSKIPTTKQVKIPFYRSKSFGLVAAACLMIAAAGAFMPAIGGFGAAKKSDNHAVSEADAAMPSAPTAPAPGYFNDVADPASPGMAAPKNPDSVTTSEKFTSDVASDAPAVQTDRFVFSGKGVLPAEIDKFNPVYLDGEVVLWLDSTADAEKIINLLLNSGFRQATDNAVSKESLDMIADKQNPIVIVLK